MYHIAGTLVFLQVNLYTPIYNCIQWKHFSIEYAFISHDKGLKVTIGKPPVKKKVIQINVYISTITQMHIHTSTNTLVNTYIIYNNTTKEVSLIQLIFIISFNATNIAIVYLKITPNEQNNPRTLIAHLLNTSSI